MDRGRDSEPGTSTVVVADRNPLYLAGLVAAVEDCGELELVGRARSIDEACDLIVHERPDVAVLGALLGHDDEREIVETIARTSDITRVICLFSHLDGELAVDALRAGAHGCLSKDAGMHEVCSTITAGGRGEMQLPPQVQDRIVDRLRRRDEPAAPPLTPREQQVLALAAEGLAAAEIARRLSLSASTVKSHLHHVYDKLEVRGRAAAVAEGVRRGLVR